MKNKTLLIAAAALVAGVVSSQAQVYSANIVGYANVVCVGAGNYTLVANPLDDGNGNQLTNIIAGLPNKSQVITWNGSSYNTAIGKASGAWSGSVALPPGTGFFVKNGISTSPAFTNTFVGTVGSAALTGGQTMTNALAAGYNLVGSQVAFAGDATTDPNINLGGTLANKSQLIDWNSGTQVFDTAVGKASGAWSSAFNITVGQGFFANSKTATNWVQTLP